ncbi:MAG: chromate transporter [Saccharofermentanales bacterium]|jgi:chromate transporter
MFKDNNDKHNNSKENKTTATNRERSLNENQIYLFQLFLILLKINSFTFGGGYTIVPVISDEFVLKRKLIPAEEMTEIVALAQSAPGPMVVNASLLTGYRIKGVLGALVSLLASVLPCLVLISILYYIYDAVSANLWVKSAFSVMGGVISGVLIVTTFSMARLALKSHPIFGSVLMIMSFVASFFFSINTGIIILVCGLIGLVVFSLFKESSVR